MVDFNNETTITRSAGDIYKTLILQKREYLIDQIEKYMEIKEQHPDMSIKFLRSRLFSLWFEICPLIYKKMKPKDKKELIDKFDNLQQYNENQLFELMYYLNDFIYKIGITKIDTRPVYDTTDPEAENEAYGL